MKGGREVGNQTDMHTCTDACKHSVQGRRPYEGWLGHTYRVTWGCIFFIQLSKGVVTDTGSQVDMHTCTDACTQSNQGWDQQTGDWDM